MSVNVRKYINFRTVRSAFIGGVVIGLVQLILDHDDPLCWKWHCLRHYSAAIVIGGLRSAWEYIKTPAIPEGENGGTGNDNTRSRSATAGN